MASNKRLNPEQLPKSPGFAQGVVVEAPARTIYVGGQNGIGANGQVVGDDVASQTTQALKNVEHVLAEAGAELTDVVHWTIVVAEGQDLGAGFGAFQDLWGTRGEPPAVSVQVVPAMGNPAFLVEITAVAAVSA
jgi:enamine deaminase RidA (YjgF/YER057c/UK114 family)